MIDWCEGGRVLVFDFVPFVHFVQFGQTLSPLSKLDKVDKGDKVMIPDSIWKPSKGETVTKNN